jgi:3-oxoadipate enol-lactonase
MILIHALCMDHRFWRDIYAELAPLGRVVAYDVRGHGHASGAPLTRDLAHVADDVGVLMNALGIERADIYGASYGGAIAQYLAVAHPDRVRSLGLLATSTLADPEELGGRADAAEAHGMEAQVGESLIRWFLPETIAANPWCVRYARQRVRQARVEEWSAAWRAMARLDVVEEARSLDQPVLLLSGTKDRSFTPDVMKYMLQSYSNATFVSIEEGTHFMPIEQPQPVAQALVDFRRHVDQAASQPDNQ